MLGRKKRLELEKRIIQLENPFLFKNGEEVLCSIRLDPDHDVTKEKCVIVKRGRHFWGDGTLLINEYTVFCFKNKVLYEQVFQPCLEKINK